MASQLMLIGGLLALASVVMPLLLRNRLISWPIMVVVLGLALPSLFDEIDFDPVAHGTLAVHVTEFGVIVALTGLGLSIDRRITLRGWATTWRLLAVTMPLSIVAAGLVGWWLVGLAPAAAVLFGAVLAPTDPVLAADVQTGPPSTGDPDADEHDEVRFALASESSLNDGLAFPFTHLAVLVAASGFAPSEWLSDWLLVDVAYRIGVGVAVGWVLGQLLGRVTLRILSRAEHPAAIASAVIALGFTLLSYGLAETLNAYGFIAVFVTAAGIRDIEREHDLHDHIHEGAEQLELFAMSVVLVLLGASLADGLWEEITWTMVGAAVLLVLVARPIAGWVGLLGDRRTDRHERLVISFFGIRGLGSLFYLAWGLDHGDFLDEHHLWALTATCVLVSLVVHGLGARPAMRWLDRQRPEFTPPPPVHVP